MNIFVATFLLIARSMENTCIYIYIYIYIYMSRHPLHSGSYLLSSPIKQFMNMNQMAPKGPNVQVLCNAVGGGRVSDFPGKSVTKMYSSTLLLITVISVTRGGWVSNIPQKALPNT